MMIYENKQSSIMQTCVQALEVLAATKQKKKKQTTFIYVSNLK